MKSKTIKEKEDIWLEECKDKLKFVELLEEFKGNSVPIKMRCKKCGYVFYKSPYELKRKLSNNCHNCDAIRRTKTQDNFIEDVKKNNKHFDKFIIGEYKNKRTKVSVECKECGYKWFATPSSLYDGSNCPNCNHGRLKTNEQFLNDLYQVNKDIIVLENYINDSTKILVRCTKCGYEWRIKPNALLNGKGCSKCKIKHLERIIDYNLNDLGVEFQKTFDWLKTSKNGCMKLDFYLPLYNIAIECQGEQHFASIDFAGRGKEWADKNFENTLLRDKIKYDKCKENGVILLYYTNKLFLKKYNLMENKYNGLYNNIFTDINKLKEYIYEEKFK